MCVNILGACIIAGRVVSMDMAYTTDMPQYAHSYDGEARMVGHFYDDEQTNFKVKGYVILDTNTKVTLGYDHGVDTAKYDKAKSYTVGVDQLFKLKDNHYLTVGAHTTFGGEVRHTACTDSYGREYYCATLTAFSDLKQKKHKQPYSVGITYKYKF